MKNFIFISPHFPVNYRNFCIKLHENGVNVLGIGDAPYDSLDYMLQGALTEYYRVNNMENYDEMYRAVAFFCFKYGKIDGLESNNEYWLEQDARLRKDFNIPGLKPETLSSIKSKSGMKKYYAQAGVPSARYHLVTDLAQSLAFIDKVGYPVIAKPDNGVGAVDTFKISSDDELKTFHEQNFGDVQFIMEEFVPGEIFSYDAIIGSHGQPLLETGNNTPRSIMEIVNNQESCFFFIEKQIKDDLREAGRRCVGAFGIRSRFIHFEFFRLLEDHAYLGKKGTIVSLEANLRPSGGFTPDMITFDKLTSKDNAEKFYCVSVGLRDSRRYVHNEQEILQKYADKIVLRQRLPEVLAHGMGDSLYLAKFSDKKDMDEFIRFLIQEGS